METINIKKEDQTENEWEFLVSIDSGSGQGSYEYRVTLDEDYYKQLVHSMDSTNSPQASSGSTPKELIKKSFEFLLAREPKESILREFNLKVISTYFPEYETEIKKLL